MPSAVTEIVLGSTEAFGGLRELCVGVTELSVGLSETIDESMGILVHAVGALD